MISSKSSLPIVYERGERIRRFGVDCADGLFWKGGTWEPGGEYVQKLVVKNVSLETIKMKYKIPETKFFSMDFPEVMKLSPGMSMTVEVVFRPIHFEPYDDFVEFVIKRKNQTFPFFISVGACLSKLAVSIPKHIDLGFCPTREVTEKKFEILNTGEIPAPFRWVVKSPFKITPESGVIQPGKNGKAVLTASIEPDDASVFVTQALCYVEGLPESPFTFKMSSIGKYAFISVNETRLDFGEQLPGKAGIVDKEIVLRNQSVVNATFEIKQVESDLVPVFSFHPTRGVVKPGKEIQFRVRYSPFCSGKFSCDHFDIITPGGNLIQVECSGTCIGPKVSISSNVGSDRDVNEENSEHNLAVQFGDAPLLSNHVKIESFPTRVLYLYNYSEEKVHFSFVCDENSEFHFLDPAQGVIPPGLDKAIRVRFVPESVGNYYRKVFCLIKDQTPLVVELIGTAYNKSDKMGNRPQPLLYRHILTHRRRELVGYGLFSPESISDLVQRDQDKSVEESLVIPERITSSSRSGGSTLGELEMFRQFFENHNEPNRPIYVSEDVLDFGAGSRLRVLEKKVLHVTNITESKVTCAWTVSWPLNEKNPINSSKPFVIYPNSADIPPGGTVQFRVAFQPNQDNLYYNVEANAIVYYKSNRTFRLVKDEAFVPPWNLCVNLQGHTFQPGSEQFLPNVKFHINKIVSMEKGDESLGSNFHRIEFPTCHNGEAVYQTIILENIGDTPAKFNFSRDPSGVFTVKPQLGLIGKNQFVSVAIECKPPLIESEEGDRNKAKQNPLKLRYQLECILNNSSEFVHIIDLTGFRAIPQASLHEPNKLDQISNVMYIKPTCIGLTTKRVYVLKNSSRIPMLFQWNIPKRLRKVIQVSPKSGSLQGNESTLLSWSFTPQQARKYSFDIPLSFSSVGSSEKFKKTLTILAQGSESAVNIVPSNLNIGTILAGTETTREITLCNRSDCDVCFEINVESITRSSTVGAEIDCDSLDEEQNALSFSIPKGILEARSEKTISVHFQPGYCCKYEFAITCNVGVANAEASELESILVGEKLHSLIQGSAAYPTIAIEDARCTNKSTSSLWKQFDLTFFNRVIQMPLSVEEIRFAKSTGVKPGGNNVKVVYDDDPLEVIDFNFTPGLLNSPSQTILLQMRNIGNLPVEFNIKFPNDSDIELEPWADEGEPTELDLEINTILDNRIFQVQPRQGCLAAGEATTLRFTYRYTSVEIDGEHELPLIFQLASGKQIRVKLRGITLPLTRPHIFIPNPVHTLEAVPIGASCPPIQTYTLMNPGGCGLEYSVDEESMNALCAENWNIPILKCLDPVGFLPGIQGTARIRWVFQPLEAKLYSCDIRINFNDPSSKDKSFQRIVTLQARGYHPKDEESETLDREKIKLMWEPPTSQMIPLPSQSASFSADWIDFGLVPKGSLVRKISVLRNQTTSPLAFEWDQKHPLLRNGLIRIDPVVGEVEPGSFVTCKFLFEQNGYNEQESRIIKCDIRCQVGSLTEMSQESRTSFFNKLKRAVSRASTSRAGFVSASPEIKRRSVVEKSTLSRDLRLSQTQIYSSYSQARNVTTPTGSNTPQISMPAATPMSGFLSPTGNDKKIFSATSIMSAFAGGSPISGDPMLQSAFAKNVKKHQILFVHFTAKLFPIQMTNAKYAVSSSEHFIPEEDNGEIEKLIKGKKRETLIAENSEEDLESMLRNVMNDRRVEEALQNLHEEPAPLFVDLLNKQSRMQKSDTFDTQNEYMLKSTHRTNKLHLQHYGRKLLALPELQNIAENIVENMVFNISQECLHGETQLKQNKQIYRLRPDLMSRNEMR